MNILSLSKYAERTYGRRLVRLAILRNKARALGATSLYLVPEIGDVFEMYNGI